MVPLHGDRRTSRNLDLVAGSRSTIAVHESRSNILDGVVAVRRSPDSKVLTLVLSTNDEALEGGMSGNEVGSSQDESSGGLHCDGGGGGCVWKFESICKDGMNERLMDEWKWTKVSVC